jgi:hypothetical protein
MINFCNWHNWWIIYIDLTHKAIIFIKFLLRFYCFLYFMVLMNWGLSLPCNIYMVRVMVFNTTFNNISVISWRSTLLVEETGVPGENRRKSQVTDKCYHIMLSFIWLFWIYITNASNIIIQMVDEIFLIIIILLYNIKIHNKFNYRLFSG